MKFRAHVEDELLAALVDGTVSRGERREILRHLADCPDCLSAAAQLMRAVGDLPSLAAVEVPDRVVERALDLVREPVSPPSLILQAVVSIVRGSLQVLEHTARIVSTSLPAPEPVRGDSPAEESLLLGQERDGRMVTVELRRSPAGAHARIAIRKSGAPGLPDGSEVLRESLSGEERVYTEGGEADLGEISLGAHSIRVEGIGEVRLELR